MNSPLSRRTFTKSLVGLTAAAAVGHGPWIHAAGRPKIRVMGTHVTLQEPLRVRAQEDLGIDLAFEPRGSAAVLQRASTRPESFDLYEQWSNSIRILWEANAIQPIDKARIRNWSEINSLTKTGRLSPEASIGSGDAPYKLLHVQGDGGLGSKAGERVSFLPYVHNVDSFGYNSAVVQRGTAYESESWGWLLQDRFRGKVATVNAPTIGLFDLALSAQALGMVEFADIGSMTKIEIDRLFDVLIRMKIDGHFSGFWSSVPESVEFMESGRCVIQSMFSPGISTLNGRGIPAIYAAPKEGYRGWHGVMCLSSRTQGRAKDVAYEYMNWWLSGWPGAFIARQGYYISNPERSREYLSAEEWNYWYAGKPTRKNLRGTDGKVSVRAGSTRNGGSYWNRFSNIAVWNSVMPTYEYSLQRWYEFLTS